MRPRRLLSGILLSLLPLVLWAVTAAWNGAQASQIGSTGGFRPEIALSGRVRTDSGAGIPMGAKVRVETESGEFVAEESVDSSGRFEISNLEKNHYVLEVHAAGFQPYKQDVDLTLGLTDYFVDIVLIRSPIINRSQQNLPALTDLRAPKQARQEYKKAERALREKNPKKAAVALEQAVEIFPCYARAQTSLGLTLSTMRKFPKAEAALRKAIACDPGFVDSYIFLGQLLNAEKRYSESEAVLHKGLRLSPGAWQFYFELGVALYGSAHYHQALKQFLKAATMSPPPPADVHVKLADVYVKLTDFDQAYGEMQAYLRAEPEGPFAPRIKDIMRQMKSAGVLHSASTNTDKPPSSNP